MMEIDISVFLGNFPRNISLKLTKFFSVEFSKHASTEHKQDVVIRVSSELMPVVSVESEVCNFLSNFEAYIEDVKKSSGVLRLGLFYNLQETVVFPLQLSAQTINILCKLNLGIDVTGYPCSDED